MYDLAVLFFHHRNDDLTRSHFKTLNHFNPRVPIIPVHRGEKEHLPCAVDCYCADDEWAGESNWSSADVAFINWWMNRTIDAERYIWLEYDTLVNCDLRDWYREVWEADAAAPRIVKPSDHGYWWWNQLDRLSADYQAAATASVPFNGLMVSHRAMEAITSRPYPLDVFCEIRMTTAIQAAGFEVVAMPEAKAGTNHFEPLREIGGAGFWHPVKS